MTDVTRDPEFWRWISERNKQDEGFKPVPLYKYVEIPPRAPNSNSNDNTGTVDHSVDHTVFQF
jgi:hypothetical protein